MPRRWSSLALGLVLAVGCTSAAAPAGDPLAAPPGASTTTVTTAALTTTPTTVAVPANVADLISATTMTDRARRAFLATDPRIEDPATFARSCGLDGTPGSPDQAQVHTQGCFERGHIHLLATDRADARELLYVVAAHELLHAVYASLGAADRARIDAELDAARVGNSRLEERLKAYGNGPTLTNEIHSLLGSEFDGLPPTLEAHYAQFFADRSQVVAARQHTLGRREDDIRRLKAEVEALDSRIGALKDGLARPGASDDVRAYNSTVALINGLISRYDASVDDLNARIDEYNALLGG